MKFKQTSIRLANLKTGSTEECNPSNEEVNKIQEVLKPLGYMIVLSLQK